MGNKNVVHKCHDGMSNGTSYMSLSLKCVFVLHISHSGSMGTIEEVSGGSCGGFNDMTDSSTEVANIGYGGCSNITSSGGGGGGDVGGAGGNGPTEKGTHDKHGVHPFLIKLYKMVDDKATDSIISWGSSSITFIISDERQFVSEILPCYFKNNRFDNFANQLNNYGFKKKECNHLEFEHKHFREGEQHLLKNIKKRTQQQLKATNNIPTTLTVAISELEATFSEVRLAHKQIKNKLHWFKDDIEKSLSEVNSIIQEKSQKLLSTFFKDRKRKLADINLGLNFGDIEKDLETTYDQFETSLTHTDCFMTLSDLTDKMAMRDSDRVGGVGDGRRVPQFLQKLYDMVEKEEINSFISWNLPHRESFIIRDINNFAAHVLPLYFTHTNFSSFNTQLNIYGFRKVSWISHEYANEWFRGGRYDLLVNIKRRDRNLQLNRSATNFSCTQVEMFKDQLKTIQQEQEKKIICLPKYEEQIRSSVHELKETVVNMANIVDKMTLGRDINHENVKKVKLDIEDNIIDLIGNMEGQDLDVDEAGGSAMTSIDNHNVKEHSYFIDLEAIEEMRKNMQMEDAWSLEREMESYSSFCLGRENEFDRKFSLDDASCS